MKGIVMCASIITAIILCVVGILKLPFKTFKAKHPKWYRAVFCTISLILAVVAPIISQLFILNGVLCSVDFLVLILTTIAGVFGLYTSYEGLGLKSLVKVIVEKVSELLNTYSESKLTKMVGKVGIEKLTEIANKIASDAKVEEKPNVEESTTPNNEIL